MIDPMAGLDGGGGGANDGAGGNGSGSKDVIDFGQLRLNLQRTDKVRSVMGIASGCLAGICGLTGFEGLCKSFAAYETKQQCSLPFDDFGYTI